MKKKTLTLLLCGAFAAVCLLPAACAPAQEDETGAPAKLNWLQTVNSYEDDKVMLIGAHGEPEPTEESYRTAAEMGLTFTFVIENVDDLHVYDLAQKVGMKTIPSMNNTLASFRGVDWSVDWSDIPSVIAVDYFDEPLEAHFDVISGWVDIHNEKYAESGGEQPLFWVNMLPLDASLQIAPQTDEEFIAQYCEEILSKIKGKPVLSYDYYPLRTMWNKLEKAYDYVAVEWLRTMELNAKYAALYGADTHAYIQTCGFYSPSSDHSTWTCRISDEAALRFQVYTSMAFGIRNFTHFTYKSSDLVGTDYGYTPACVSKEGEKYPLYYDAQTVNRELLAFDHIFLAFGYTGTKCIVGTQNETGSNAAFDLLEYGLETLPGLRSVSATRDTVVGAFEDEEGRKGYVLSNYTDPIAQLSDTVTLQPEEGVSAFAVCEKGEWREEKVVNGSVEIELAPGGGVFLIAIE